MKWPPGTKVRLKTPCAWPERGGRTATIVAPRRDGIYPQPASWEVLLLLDDDPFIQSNNRGWWSCVMDAKDVEPLHSDTTEVRASDEQASS